MKQSNKTYYPLVVALIIMLLINACSETLIDDGDPEKNVNAYKYDVDITFQAYIDTFLHEGAKRGKTIEIYKQGLRMKFANVADYEGKDGTAGITFTDSVPVTIYIDREYWNKQTTNFDGGAFEHAFVIYHELGHGLLKRSHKNTRLFNGDYASIMVGGDLPANTLNRANFRGMRVSYYFDELFKSGILPPTWGDSLFYKKYLFIPNERHLTHIFNASTFKKPMVFDSNIYPDNDVYYELVFGFDSVATDDEFLTFSCNGNFNKSNYEHFSSFIIYKNGLVKIHTHPEGDLVYYSLNRSNNYNTTDTTTKQNTSTQVSSSSSYFSKNNLDTIGIRITQNMSIWYYNRSPIYYTDNQKQNSYTSVFDTKSTSKTAFYTKYFIWY